MIIEGRKLVRTLDIHKHLTQEIKIVFKTDGAHITSVDPVHQRMVTTVLKNAACREYDIDEIGDLVIGIDLVKIRDFLKIGRPDDVFTFDYDRENHKLVARLGNLVRTMGLLDIEGMPELKPPELLWVNKTKLGAKVFYAGVKAIMLDNKKDESGMNVSLTITNEGLIFENRGDRENENTMKNAVFAKDRDIISHLCRSTTSIVFNVAEFEKQIREYKRSFCEVTVETNDNRDLLKISASNKDMIVEYYQTVIIEKSEKALKTREKESLSKLKSAPAVKEPEIKARKSPEPVVVGKTKKPSMKVLKKDIGWLASPKDNPHMVGEIIQVTKTGYVLLFRGSKKHSEPVEYERDLVEVYHKVKKR
jgi:hypothetical protein